MSQTSGNDTHECRLRQCRSLTPLACDELSSDTALADALAQHNGRLSKAVARLEVLPQQRARLVDFHAWQDADAATIVEVRDHRRREAWDLAREFGRLLGERQELLRQCEAALTQRWHDAHAEHDREVARAERRLRKEQRALMQANPTTANAHFDDLVTAEASVEAASERVQHLRVALAEINDQLQQLHRDRNVLIQWQRTALAELVR